MPNYLVVARAESGVRFGKDDSLRIEQLPTSVGPVDILFKTRPVSLAGFTKPVPMGLLAEITGPASSLDGALTEFSRAAQSLCPVFALIGNSPIEDMAPELGYDASPGIAEREYFQQHFPDERLLVVERRLISADLAGCVLKAVAQHSDADRIRRVLAQYYQALRNWQPGYEVLALAHLWMAVEALTPISLRRALHAKGMDRAALASHWEVEEKQLEAEVRKRLIMRGDANAYRRARQASDGFEHGYLSLPEVHAHSAQVRVDVAMHLRRSILDELELETSAINTLNESPYDRPGHIHIAKYIRGKLVAKTSNLAAPGQTYPILRWKTSYRDTSELASEEITIEIDDTFTGVFASDVSFHLTSIELWGGQESTLKANARSTVPAIKSTIVSSDG